MENTRILIIDDDEGIRQTYLNILTPDPGTGILAEGMQLFGVEEAPPKPLPPVNYEVCLAESGYSGLEKIKEGRQNQAPFAAAFIDMKMPGLNGAQTAKKIWEADPHVKIVIVTAYSEYSPEEIIATTGRDDLFYLRKPFNREEILQFARALTNEWNLEQKRAVLEAELKEANQCLEAMNQGLEQKVKKQAAMIVQSEKMATVGLLAAGVAHEINNPISFINSNLSILKKYCEEISRLYDCFKPVEAFLVSLGDPQADALMESVAKVKNQGRIELIFEDIGELVDESLEGVDRVKTIVRDLRTFSRMDDAQAGWADLNGTIEAALKMIKNEVKYSIEVKTAFSPLPEIRCYPQKLAQVFINLLVNAVQAIEERGTVSILTEADADRQVRIVISDTGCGISKEHMSILFDPFFTTKPVGKGTGLGLSIVYEIVKSHGGSIDVESRVGEGTRFTILLPMDCQAKREEIVQ